MGAITHGQEVNDFRSKVRLLGFDLTIAQATKLLKLVGREDVCVDALLMEKRPAWLVAIVGEKKK